MDELLSEFLTETSESLSLLDLELVNLEKNPNDAELISSIFRLVHTIKGTCGFLGLPRLEAVAHAGENILSKYRDKELDITAEGISAILEALDCIKMIMAHLEQEEKEPDGDDKELIERLNNIASGHIDDSSVKNNEVSLEEYIEGVDIETDLDVKINKATKLPEEKTINKKNQANTPLDDNTQQSNKNQPQVASQSIRLNVNLLEDLMTMVSELVLTRNQLLQMIRGDTESKFNVPLQRLSQVTSELQENVMKTRMQPIGSAWAKLPRIIRDLAIELDKKIDLKMIGAETELDRQVLEIIKDPLTHMVRNSADHGIEMPNERVELGKPEIGQIKLNAFHEGGHIIIEISDDGRGLSPDKIRAKAIENGLITDEHASTLTEQQLLQYIFKPGFSTAEKITNVSGRGVGMDVVRTNIEKIGGTIELESNFGKGTKCIIKIPLTLAIVSALIVKSTDELFAIPQLNVLELVKTSEDSEHKIEFVKNAPVLRLRDRLLPLISLKNVLKLDEHEESLEEMKEDYIVVTQVGSTQFGIIVDQIYDTEEIVVKPVSPILRDISIFSGNTILGDGSVIMILDPNGIASTLGEVANTESSSETSNVAEAVQGVEKIAFVLFRGGSNIVNAVPLDLIARLEVIDTSSIEKSNDVMMVQYRGQLMPLISIGNYQYDTSRDKQSVIVFAEEDRFVGLIVDEIVDIIEDYLKVELNSERQGYIGTAIIKEQATDIIDAGYYLSQICPGWFSSIDQAYAEESIEAQKPKRVLLIDDSSFFRNLLSPVLNVAGYDVTAVDCADNALSLYDEGYDFDVIVSDIEMPGMSGFDLAKSLKSDGGRWKDVPLFALSAHTTRKDIEKGKQAGFNDFIAKTDRDYLLDVLSKTFSEIRGAA